MLNIIDCCKTKKYGTQYKATYIGNWEEWNVALAWQLWKIFKNAKKKISKFYKRHPKKLIASPELTSSNKYDPKTVH